MPPYDAVFVAILSHALVSRVTKKCTRNGFALHVPRHPNHDPTGYDCSLGTFGKVPHRHRGAATAAAATAVVVVGAWRGWHGISASHFSEPVGKVFYKEFPNGQREITARPHSPFAATAVAATAVAVAARKDDWRDDDISTRILPRLSVGRSAKCTCPSTVRHEWGAHRPSAPPTDHPLLYWLVRRAN